MFCGEKNIIDIRLWSIAPWLPQVLVLKDTGSPPEGLRYKHKNNTIYY